jgi:hypothetical protein
LLPLRTEPPSRPVESLSGLIERVTFHNEENGWAVLKVKAKGHRDLVAVVGSLPSVSAGEWVTAEGRWVQDKEFGLQFRADMLNSTAVVGRNRIWHSEGIERGWVTSHCRSRSRAEEAKIESVRGCNQVGKPGPIIPPRKSPAPPLLIEDIV